LFRNEKKKPKRYIKKSKEIIRKHKEVEGSRRIEKERSNALAVC
jgi:hypothetical protein